MLQQKCFMSSLKDKKIRSTPFREEVLAIFKSSNYALSLQSLEEKLDKHDRITLYRTLKTFKEKGVIHEIALPNEPIKYALCKKNCSDDHHHHNHIHFKCNNCEEVFCKDVKELPKIIIPNFNITELEISAKGICENCNN
jgi:Fur family ferric uptake transcriptional regulator